MTIVNASCPCCQDVTLQPPDITLVIIRPVIDNRDLSFFTFMCPTCHDEVKKAASKEAQKMLQDAGTKTAFIEVPDEFNDTRRVPATRLTVDEVLDFKNLNEEELRALFFGP